MTNKSEVSSTEAKKLGKNARKTITAEEMRFVLAYNGSMSETARVTGLHRQSCYMMMKRPRVRKALDKKIEEALKASGRKLSKLLCMTAEEVNHGLAQLATYDVRKCVTENNSVIPIKQWGDAEGMALNSFEISDICIGSGATSKKIGELKKFKMADRGQNLERIGRVLGMFIERQMADLPHDWDSHTLEEKRFYVRNKGRWPDPGEI